MKYARYVLRTGEILGTMDITDQITHDLHATGLCEGEYSAETKYILNGSAVNRPTQSTVVDATEIDVATEEQATFTLLPDPCTVTIIGPNGVESVEITGGTLEFSASFPGDYTMTFESFPHLPYSVVISAV
jgi:hypothetical protein